MLSYFSSITARLYDILQMRFTEAFATLPDYTLTNISPVNPIRRLAKVLGYTTLRLLGNIIKPINNPDTLDDKIWLYVVSQNNYNALHFIKKRRNNAIAVAGQGKQIGRYNAIVNRISLRKKILYYWQLPLVFIAFIKKEGIRAWRFFDLIYAAIGYYEVYRYEIRKAKPRAVIFANDHNDDSRALLLACKREGIPTAYIQHASVSTYFPPLSFDLSLLEGQDALDKYSQCGPIKGMVKLVGKPQADAFYKHRNTNHSASRLGLACNLIDEFQSISSTVAYLAHAMPDMPLTFRAHPGDQRNFESLQNIHPNLRFSNSRQETVFDFLSRQDVLLAADTSTHLEATSLNIAAIYFRFGSHNLPFDY